MKSKILRWIMAVLIIKAYGVFGADINNLYTNHRAMKIDDILTVLVMEEAKAGSQSGTNTAKKNSASVKGMTGSGALSFLPQFGASAGTDVAYDGKGSTTRAGSLAAKISARVIKVLDNGNLVIEGSKTVEINTEKEIIQISGIVRPSDVGSDNTIVSYQISDAKITYSGKGTANTGQRPGLLARFLNWLL
jgi:flagellar L-ring protein precursor FlgH